MFTNNQTIQSRTLAQEDFMENTRFETSLAVCVGMSTKSSQIALTKELASLSRIPDLTCFQRGFITRLQAKNLLEISGREWEAMGIMRIQLTSKKEGAKMINQKNIPRQAQPRRGNRTQITN